jgi:hypothetical protein
MTNIATAHGRMTVAGGGICPAIPRTVKEAAAARNRPASRAAGAAGWPRRSGRRRPVLAAKAAAMAYQESPRRRDQGSGNGKENFIRLSV